jgi:hypothetical protein
VETGTACASEGMRGEEGEEERARSCTRAKKEEEKEEGEEELVDVDTRVQSARVLCHDPERVKEPGFTCTWRNSPRMRIRALPGSKRLSIASCVVNPALGRGRSEEKRYALTTKRGGERVKHCAWHAHFGVQTGTAHFFICPLAVLQNHHHHPLSTACVSLFLSSTKRSVGFVSMESNNGGKQLLYAGQLTLKQRGLLGGHTSVYVHLYPYRLDVLTSSPERDGSEPRPTSDLRFSLDLTRISQLKVKCSGGNLQIRVWVAGDKHVLCAPDVQSFAAWVQRFKFYLLEEEVRADLDVRQLLSGSAIDVTQAQEARGWSLVDTHAPRTAAEEITSERVPDEDGEWELLSGPSASAPASASVTNTYAHSTTDASDDAKCREGEHSEVLDIPQARRSARQVAGLVQRLFCARTEVPSTRVFSSNGIGACQTAKSVKRFCRAGGAMDLRDVREVILRTLLIKTGRPRDMPSNEEFAGICARYLALHTETLGAAFASHDNNRVPRNFTHAMPAFSTKAFDWGLDR